MVWRIDQAVAHGQTGTKDAQIHAPPGEQTDTARDAQKFDDTHVLNSLQLIDAATPLSQVQ
jgi:hypothetical protein